MITETDKNIIKLLQNNGRASYSDIAHSLGITPSTAAKRIKFLLDSGTITVRGLLNPYRLGLEAGAVIFIKVEHNKKAAVCAELNHELFTSTILETLGNFDLFCIYRCRTWTEVNTFITERLAKMEGVLDYDCRFIDNTIKRFQVFGAGKLFDKAPDLKKIDWEIIRQLCLDGRQNNSDMAEQLNLHVSTISRRIQYLFNEDYLRILPQPNPSKFDYTSSIIVTAFLQGPESKKICETIAGYNEVFLLAMFINRPQIIFGVHTSSNDKTSELVKMFLNLPGLVQNEIFIRSNIVKTNYWWHTNSLK